ncbi:MAG: hypothetical protein J0L97_07675 [Alphaproteobacteria bacterium]|nr:hypothetical protein [Alphaproteobacteria bacterium]
MSVVVLDQERIRKKEEMLQDVCGLPFRYVGSFTQDKVFVLQSASEYFARIIVTELNRAIEEPQNRAFVQGVETVRGEDRISYHFKRWNVRLPLMAVHDEFLDAVSRNDFLCGELAGLFQGLRERYYDVVTAVANAASCQRTYEQDLLRLVEEREAQAKVG